MKQHLKPRLCYYWKAPVVFFVPGFGPRAIDIVRIALDALWPRPIYVRKEIVHNRYVVEDLKEKGRNLLSTKCYEVPRRARRLDL